MDKRKAGMDLIRTAGTLFGLRYLTASVYMADSAEKSRELFSKGLEYTGYPLLILSIVSVIAGIAYLIWAEVEKRR